MTVFVLMPVHNRLSSTQDMVGMLRAQEMDQALRIVVVDDGSSDGTAEWLESQADVTVINGDGSLWWGGAIHQGYLVCDGEGQDDDWVLFVNDDTEIRSDFIAHLLAVSRANPMAIVGTILRHIDPPHELLSVAPVIDTDTIDITDLASDPDIVRMIGERDWVSVDALSGRGVLYPLKTLRQLHGIKRRFFPHYLADYELSLRARALGWTLLAATNTAVYSYDVFGNQQVYKGWWRKYFSIKSPSYFPAVIGFWWQAEAPRKRFVLPYKMVLRAFRKER